MFSVIRTIGEWELYCRQTAEQYHLVGVGIDFGKGPMEYPCLAAPYYTATDPLRVVNAFVYRTDVEQLMAALHGVADVLPTPPTQTEFNKDVSANILAIVNTLVGIRAVTKQAYEDRYQAARKCVDEWSEEDRRRLLALTVLQSLPDDI